MGAAGKGLFRPRMDLLRAYCSSTKAGHLTKVIVSIFFFVSFFHLFNTVGLPYVNTKIINMENHNLQVNLRSSKQFIEPLPDLWTPRVRIAYLMSAHNEDTVSGIGRLLDSLYHPLHDFIIHFDSKINASITDAFKQKFENVTNVHWIDSINVEWAKYSIVEMHLNQLHKAKEIGHFDVAINICGASSPIKSNYAIDEYLFKSVVPQNGSSMISYASLEPPCNPASKANYVCDRSGHGNSEDQCLDKECTKIKGSPGNRPFFKGFAWFILRPDFVDYALYSPDAMIWQEYFKGGFMMSDESYFQTVYYYSPFYYNMSGEDILKIDPMFTDWRSECLTHENKRPMFSPCYLGINDFGQLRVSDQIFARKFYGEDLVHDWIAEMVEDPRSPKIPIPFKGLLEGEAQSVDNTGVVSSNLKSV